MGYKRSTGKLTEADGARVVAARLRQDLSALFELPCVSTDVVPAPQPAAFRGRLFDYQRRSLTRMLEIERGTMLEIEFGNGTLQKFSPQGGVVADTVGMGKTAQLIALLLAKTPENVDPSTTIAALVLTPEHLCHQWRTEIAKFSGDALDVRIATNAAEVAALSPQVWTGRGGTARVLIASLEYVGTNYDEFIARLLLACVRRFDRLILDECHEAVLLNGGHTMHVLLSLRDLARHVWCVSGTPFPEGDRSVFGLHQLLGVHVNFVLTNSPFLGGMAAGKRLPPSHPFEQLKRLVYLRNTPASVGDEVEGSRLVEEAPHAIEISRLRFDPIERGFYDEQARRANVEAGGDSFSIRFEALRRLCCHPAVSAAWSSRLAGERGGRGGASGSAANGATGAQPLLSLDEMRERMVRWKGDEITKAKHALDLTLRHAAAARAACTLVLDNRPSLRQAWGDLEDTNAIRRSGGIWRLIDSYRGAYHEDKRRRAHEWAMSQDESAARAFLETTRKWLAESHATELARQREELARAEREMRFFEGELAKVESLARGSVQESSAGSSSDGAGASSAASPCVICLETPEVDVGVLPCGHCAGCGPCVRAWIMRAGVCPTCRRATHLHDVSFVSLGAPRTIAPAASSAACAPCSKPPLGRAIDAVAVDTSVDPFEAERWGTKPAAIIAHLRRVLADAASRAIVFSAYDECLALLASTFHDAGIDAVRCEGDAATRHAAIAAFADTSSRDGPRVLLLSSQHNASGTNLQCADHVILVEPPGTVRTRDSNPRPLPRMTLRHLPLPLQPTYGRAFGSRARRMLATRSPLRPKRSDAPFASARPARCTSATF